MTRTAQHSDPPDTERPPSKMQEIDQADANVGERVSDSAGPARQLLQMSQMTKVGRIDERGDIREHLTRDGRRTICGIKIRWYQTPCDNAPCKRCEKIAARCQIAPAAASGDQSR